MPTQGGRKESKKRRERGQTSKEEERSREGTQNVTLQGYFADKKTPPPRTLL